MSIFSQQMTVNLYTEKIADEEVQLLDISHSLDHVHRQSSSDQEDVRSKYAPQKEDLQNRMRSEDSTISDEYMQCMMELNELREQEDTELSGIEERANDLQSKYEQQKESIETTLAALKADKEGFEQNLQENVEDEFSYFQ